MKKTAKVKSASSAYKSTVKSVSADAKFTPAMAGKPIKGVEAKFKAKTGFEAA